MTRSAQPGFDPGLYDEDFYDWTQRQAAALRTLPRQTTADVLPVDLASLDIAHLAEEIEDLGKRDLREVMSYLRLVIQHLVKLQAVPDSRDAAHWHTEVVNFQLLAREAFSPGMRRLIDVDDIWIGGCRAAGRFLKDHGARDPSRDACPFTAREAFSPGMRRLIDVDDLWVGGCHAAGRFLKDHGASDPPSRDACPAASRSTTCWRSSSTWRWRQGGSRRGDARRRHGGERLSGPHGETVLRT